MGDGEEGGEYLHYKKTMECSRQQVFFIGTVKKENECDVVHMRTRPFVTDSGSLFPNIASHPDQLRLVHGSSTFYGVWVDTDGPVSQGIRRDAVYQKDVFLVLGRLHSIISMPNTQRVRARTELASPPLALIHGPSSQSVPSQRRILPPPARCARKHFPSPARCAQRGRHAVAFNDSDLGTG